MHADKRNADCLKDILDRYCQSSGRMLSAHKLSDVECTQVKYIFSENTCSEAKEEVKTSLNIEQESFNDKYLGLPALVGADRSVCFRYLIDRICERTHGWKETQLSIGGKEVLIKSIAQAIPKFVMMVFQIPKNICKGMTDAISQFWWGDDDEKKRIHWQAWWKILYTKE